MAELHPDLRRALFGAAAVPFSITLVFPAFEGKDFPRALELARASAEFQEVTSHGQTQYRARFFPGDAPLQLRELYEVLAHVPNTDVLIDDRPLPFARELWLPLVWCLIK